MPLLRPPALLLAVVLGVGLLSAGACERQAPEPEPAPPAAGQGEVEAEAPAEEPVEEIQQGPGGLDQAAPAEPGGGEGTAGGAPMANLPGYTPPDPDASKRTLAPQPPPAMPVTAATPDDAAVFVQVTMLDITNGDEGTLAPLAQFLEGGEDASLDPDEALALDELLRAIEADGALERAGQASVLVNAGRGASIATVKVGPAGVGGVETSRHTLNLDVLPTLTAPTGEGPEAERLVRVEYDLRIAEAQSGLQVVAENLGLPIGPRARVAGAAVVRSGDSFYLVRRVVGVGEDSEWLILVRPQVMAGQLNK